MEQSHNAIEVSARQRILSGGELLELIERSPRMPLRSEDAVRLAMMKTWLFGDDAAKLIIAVDMAAGPKAAMAISGAILSAVWAQQRNIADEKTLAELLKEQHLPASCLEQAYSQAAQMRYESYTQMAIDAGVSGAPSSVVDGEIFWGQDRLDFVERALAV
mgnify:CR=1 FL=1